MNQQDNQPTDPQAAANLGAPVNPPAPTPVRAGSVSDGTTPPVGDGASKPPKEGKHSKAPKEGKADHAKGDQKSDKSGGKPGKGEKGDKGGKGKDAGKDKDKDKPKAPPKPAEPPVPPRMRDRYRTVVAGKIKQEFGITNPMALPQLDKIMVVVGIGKQIEGTKLNAKAKEQVLKDLTVITGQKPVMTLAKKSVANFKLREGFEIGAMVTLRGARMWEFFDRLVSLAIPRIKDFRGLSPKSFDGRGNYSFGVQEQGLFPEVNMAEAEFTHGMHITFVFRNSDDKKSFVALREMGVPFTRPDDQKTKAKTN
jgi:large subunit ribosomal protein L5